MQHPDGDDLPLLALDETLGSDIDRHLTGCAPCSAEVQAYRSTIGLAALSNYGEHLPRPAEAVWQAIVEELGLDTVSGPAGTVLVASGEANRAETTGAPVPGLAEHLDTAPGVGTTRKTGANGNGLTSVPGTGSDLPPAERHTTTPAVGRRGRDGTDRRWSRWTAPLAAVVVGIAVGAGAVVISQNRGSDVTVEAVAPLTAVPGGPLTADQQRRLGQAELIAAPTGTEVIVDAPDLPPSANNAYEVWLFGNDGRMVSLGTLSNGVGTFTVPNGISTAEYRTVDVSDEPPNGNPAHSGISMVRGSFS